MGLADDAEAFASSLGLAGTARAVRDEVATARRIVRENLNEASLGVQEVRGKLQHTFGVGAGSVASVCDLCALPFVHGPALQPEIRKLEALDRCPEEGSLRTAREELKQLDHELQLVSSAPVGPLQPLADGSSVAAGSSAVAAVAALLRREASHDEARVAEERVAMERAHALRAEFVQRLDAEHSDRDLSADSPHAAGAR